MLKKIKAHCCLPLIVGMSISTGSLFLWWGLHTAERSHIEQTLEQKANALNTEITEQVEPQVLALMRMARHWEQEGGLSQENWEQEARLNFEDFKGYKAIAWVDPTFQVRWVVPIESNQSVQSLRLDFEPKRRAALEIARQTGQLTITPYIDLVGGGKGFVAIIPIMQDHQPVGYIVGIFQVQILFNILLDDYDIRDYSIRVFSGNKKLYSRHNADQAQDRTLVQENIITLYGLNWRLQVAPTQRLLERTQSYLPEVSLLSGLSLAWLLALAIYLVQQSDRTAQQARSTAIQLQSSNESLEHEIHQRQQTEKLLQTTQKRLEHLLSCSPTVIYSCNVGDDYGTTYVSQNITPLFGYTVQDFLKNSGFWLDHVHPEDAPRVIATLPLLLERGHASHEYRFLHRDGSYRWVSDELRVVRNAEGHPVEIVGSLQDITERKQVEEDMRKTREFLQTVVDNVPVALFVKDGRTEHFGEFKLWNKTSEKIFGIPMDEVIGLTDSQLFPKEQADFFYQKDQQTFAQGTPEDIPEEPIRTRNLGDRILHTIKVPIFNDRQEPEYLLCISQDITRQKQAEKRLQQSLQELADFKFALDASSIVSITDEMGNIQYVNQKFCEVSQYGHFELIGQNHRIIKSSYHPPEFFTDLWNTITRGDIWRGEICNRTKQGELYWVNATIIPLMGLKGVPTQYIAINIDITEKKLLEQQFLRVQRMESLGTLAGGIAHDLNNILAPITMATQLLKMQSQDDHTKQWLEIMEGSARRGAELVKQVLSFTRGMDGEHTHLQVDYLIHEIKQVLEETFPRYISIQVNIRDNLWGVNGDATQLHQVLMNLCINARDAMPQGGTLSIAAKNVVVDERWERSHPELKPGHHLEIIVSDTGTGISPQILDRIFEPFFTTKDFGKGTGMGLSTVIGIIKSHRGSVTVTSEVNQGTEFKVYLPSAEPLISNTSDNDVISYGHNELILIVDDEDAICNIAKASLEAYHYRVITTNKGAEATTLYIKYKDEIQLVLVDMMMPEMNGLTTIQNLRNINPGIPFVLMSGLVSELEIPDSIHSQEITFLSKPFTTHELATVIKKSLENKHILL